MSRRLPRRKIEQPMTAVEAEEFVRSGRSVAYNVIDLRSRRVYELEKIIAEQRDELERVHRAYAELRTALMRLATTP